MSIKKGCILKLGTIYFMEKTELLYEIDKTVVGLLDLLFFLMKRRSILFLIQTTGRQLHLTGLLTSYKKQERQSIKMIAFP